MTGPGEELSKTRALKMALVFEIIGFLFIILTCWLTEYFDPPFNLRQVLIETAGILIIGSITVYWTWQFINRIKYLEGFMVICGSCKKVKELNGHWVSLEQIISGKSDLQFSHGICPECAKKLYREFLK
jgi:hypothetical protein